MEQTDELKEAVLNVAQRRKRGMVLKRMKNRLKVAKERASHRIADGSHLMHRARKLALAMLRKRFAGKLGADYKNLTPGQKIQVDTKIEGKSALVTRIAQKLLPKVRAKEFERYKGRMGGVKEEYVLEGQMEDKYQAISKKEHDDILAQHLNSKASNNHKASKHVFKDDDGKVVTQRYSHADHKLPPVWSKHHGDQKFTYFKRKESVKEEVEQLDELSTATLKSYKTKAGVDARYASMSKRYHEGNANDPKNGEGHRAFAKKAAGEFAHLEKKRTEGIKRAAARLKEEIESVEEISKETLKSYMDKAKDAAEDHRSNEDYLRSTGENQAEANKEQKKYWKRTFGRKAAYQKLLTKEEVESVDEISTPTLRSYIGKAGKQTKGNQPSDPNKLRKRTNREKGINLAARKIFGVKGVVKANEEVEPVEELSKPLLTRYVKKAIARAGEHDYTSGMMDADGITGVAKHHANLGDKKRAGISKAVDRLASVKEGTGTDGTIPVKRNTDGIKSGAGLTGTPELVWKYKSQTPGQNQKTETVTPSTDAKIREFVEALDEATQFTISFDKNDKKSALLFAAKVDDIKGASVLNVTGKNLIVKASDDIEDEFATIADELGVGIKIKKS